MFNRILSMALTAVLGQVIQQRVRKGSIVAVKNYIQLVRLARMATLGLVGLSIAASILVAGILLVVVGVVGLLPIDPNTVAMILLGIGAVLSILALVGFSLAFREQRWLEISKAYDLMDAALGPWDGVLPPNPMEVLLRDQPGYAAAVHREVKAEVAPPLESELAPLSTPESKTEPAPAKKSQPKNETERDIRGSYPQMELAPV